VCVCVCACVCLCKGSVASRLPASVRHLLRRYASLSPPFLPCRSADDIPVNRSVGEPCLAPTKRVAVDAASTPPFGWLSLMARELQGPLPVDFLLLLSCC
jgi:hypothetical protein